MDKTIRCTICTWRGSWTDAASMPPPRPSQIPPPLEAVQHAMEEKAREHAAIGNPVPPPCPVCGHHTEIVKIHRAKPAG